MGTKTIKTRIKNRIDDLSAWQGAGVELLPGEIALVKVDTQQIDETTGNVVNIPAVLMKVGEDGKTFDQLPWLSAKAADVYDWAKNKFAKDVPVSVKKGTDTTATSSTLGAWLKDVYDTGVTNTTDIAANAAAIAKLTGGADSDSIASLIKKAIEELDGTISGTGPFVTNVTQTDGKITVYKDYLEVDMIPQLPATKINSGTETLDNKLFSMDQSIAANRTDILTVPTMIYNYALDNFVNSGGTGDYVSGFKNEGDGQVGLIKKSFPDASTTKKGMVKLGVTGGAADFDTVDELSDTVEEHTTKIAALENAVAGGVHFVGITATDLSQEANKNNKSVTINGNTYNANTGDIVIQNNTSKEYIWTGSEWQELGDQSRIGAIETKISGLDTDPTASGTATAFINSIKKDANGKLVATKANIPVVSTSTTGTAGLTTLGVSGGAATYESVDGANGVVPRVAAIESDFIKYKANSDTSKPGTLVIGKSGEDQIIFDCGGASL